MLGRHFIGFDLRVKFARPEIAGNQHGTVFATAHSHFAPAQIQLSLCAAATVALQAMPREQGGHAGIKMLRCQAMCSHRQIIHGTAKPARSGQ